MKILARSLRYELDRPVLNETKAEGNYNFRIHFEEGNRDLASPELQSAAAVGSIFTALREVGLKLEARKLPIEVLVIESAERPSGN